MSTKPTFVILGGAGKIAKYHFEAIEKVGGEIVGIIDPTFDPTMLSKYKITNYFPTIRQFEEYFPVDLPEYFVICSPNHLHVEHSTWALKYGDVICEKPLAISTSELAYLKSEESLGQTKVYPIMQMRKHPMLYALHEQFQKVPPHEIYIDYFLPRDESYYTSWQGDVSKSGGIIFNIAIHMIDFLVWTFGEPSELNIFFNHEKRVMGKLRFEKTIANFQFSTGLGVKGRQLIVDNHYIGLTYPFPLHGKAYQDIMSGHPLSISDLEPTIKLCEEIRNYK